MASYYDEDYPNPCKGVSPGRRREEPNITEDDVEALMSGIAPGDSRRHGIMEGGCVKDPFERFPHITLPGAEEHEKLRKEIEKLVAEWEEKHREAATKALNAALEERNEWYGLDNWDTREVVDFVLNAYNEARKVKA